MTLDVSAKELARKIKARQKWLENDGGWQEKLNRLVRDIKKILSRQEKLEKKRAVLNTAEAAKQKETARLKREAERLGL